MILLMMSSAGLAFGGHYHIELYNGGIEGYENCKEKIDDRNNTYQLICTDPGFNYNIYQGLEKTIMREFISETGQVHNIAEILKTQEDLLQKVSKMASRLDSDMIAVSKNVNGRIIIDIYTGVDARKNENLLNEEK